MKKRCAVCKKKVGLGVRFLNLWNGFGWTHIRFCGARCEERFEKDHKNAVQKLRWHRHFAGGSA